MVRVVDQRLEIPLQMGPAPLQTPNHPIHLGPIAHHRPVEPLREELVQDRGGPRRPQGEHGETGSHAGPQPGFHRAFLGGGFVDRQHLLDRKLADDLLVRRTEGGGGLVLQLDHPSRRTRLPQDLLQKESDAPLRLPKAAHQERHQSHQLRTRLTGRNAGRQFGTRRDPASGAQEAMKLIFRHEGPDLRHLPDLMPPWIGIVSCQPVATAATGWRLNRDHLAALIGGDQGPFVLGMTGLATPFLPGWLPWRCRLGMRMLRTGWKRGILRSPVEPRLEFLDAHFEFRDPPLIEVNQRLDDCLGFGRQSGQLLGRDRWLRHGGDVADFPDCAKPDSAIQSLRAVNGYDYFIGSRQRAVWREDGSHSATVGPRARNDLVFRSPWQWRAGDRRDSSIPLLKLAVSVVSRGRRRRRGGLGACHPGHNAANYCQQRSYRHNRALYKPHNISHLAYH